VITSTREEDILPTAMVIREDMAVIDLAVEAGVLALALAPALAPHDMEAMEV
jgi:hypothetical protein